MVGGATGPPDTGFFASAFLAAQRKPEGLFEPVRNDLDVFDVVIVMLCQIVCGYDQAITVGQRMLDAFSRVRWDGGTQRVACCQATHQVVQCLNDERTGGDIASFSQFVEAGVPQIVLYDQDIGCQTNQFGRGGWSEIALIPDAALEFPFGMQGVEGGRDAIIALAVGDRSGKYAQLLVGNNMPRGEM